jgi:hypothetical protein
MDIQATKIELVKMILNLENPKIVAKIITLLKSEQADFWNDLSENDKNEIRLGIDELDKGEGTSFNDFMRKVS